MDKKTFIESYVTAFLAQWTVNRIDIDQMCPNRDAEIFLNPPVEMAYKLAFLAWKRVEYYAYEKSGL